MKDEIISQFENRRGGKFKNHESPAKIFKEYLIEKIESAMFRFRQKRIKKLEQKMNDRYPEYKPLKALEEEEHEQEQDEKDSKNASDNLKPEHRKVLEIVDIYFCFDQEQIIKKLIKRGPLYKLQSLSKEKEIYDELKSSDKAINELVTEIKEKCSKDTSADLKNIKSFFVIFKTELAQ